MRKVHLAVDYLRVYEKSSLKIWRHPYQFLQDSNYVLTLNVLFFFNRNVHISPVLV